MTTSPSPPAKTLLVAAVLVGVPFLLFRGLLSFDRILYERDLHLLLWSQVHSFQEVLARGALPLWDPMRGFGEPMLANPSAQVLYPWTWMAPFTSPDRYYTLFVVGHFVWAAAGMFVWGRRLGLSRAAALLASAAFAASGPLLSLTSLWHHLAGASWMPWVLAAAEGVLRAPTPRGTLALGAALALQSLAGSADMCLMTGLVGCVIPGRHLVSAWRAGSLRASLVALALATAFAASVALVVWLPAFELLGSSARAALAPGTRAAWSAHPWNLLQVAVPLLPHEVPLRAEVRALLFDSREPFLNSLYLGAATVPFIGASLLGARRRLALALLLIALLAALVSLGRFGILYDLATTLAPPLRSVRYPVKAMLAAALAWALACGIGLDAWRASPPSRRSWSGLVVAPTAVVTLLLFLVVGLCAFGPNDLLATALSFEAPGRGAALAPVVGRLARTTVLALLVLLLGASALAARFRRRIGGAALLAAVAAGLELVSAHEGMNDTAARPLFASPPPVVEALRADGATRLFVFDYVTKVLGKPYRRPDPRLPVPNPTSDLPVPLRGALAAQAFLCPATSPRWDLRGSFEPDFLGLKPRPLQNLNLVVRASEETPSFLRFLQIGAVSHVVGLHSEGLEDLEPLVALPDANAGTVRAFRVPHTLPRAYAVGQARRADGLAAYRLLADPGFDLRREIVLPEAREEAAARDDGEWRAALVSDLPTDVRIAADLPADGYVVLVDAFDPGWQATVDGRPEAVLRANMGFRAVRVPRGPHLVAFTYEPRGLRAGLGAALGGTALVAAFLFVAGRRAPGGRAPAPTS